MDRARHWTGNSRAPLTLLALALFLRVLVPAGWMPAEQGFGISLCGPAIAAAADPTSAHGAGQHAGTEHAGKTHEHHRQGKPVGEEHAQSHPCSFTLLAAALLAPPQMPGLSVPPSDVELPRQIFGLLLARLALAAPPPPATGPPHFS